MASPSPAVSHHRGRVAALTRSRPNDDPDLVSARQELEAAKLESAVKKAISSSPPLTDEQRERIASLLRVTHNRPQAAHADQGLPDADHDRIGGDV